MFLGKHYIINFYQCDENILSHSNIIKDIIEEASEIGKFSTVESFYKQFKPYGVSGATILKESHITIHTWPEYGFAAVDIFLCDENCEPEKAIKFLSKKLKSDNYEVELLNRGYIYENR